MAAIDSLLDDLNPARADPATRGKRIQVYLTMTMTSCARRMPEDRALLTDLAQAVERAKPERIERVARYEAQQREPPPPREVQRREPEGVAEQRVERELAPALDRKAIAEENERRERERIAAAAERAAEEERKAAAERERLVREGIAAAAARKAEQERRAAGPLAPAMTLPNPEVAGIAGTYRCGLGEENRVLHLGEAGEAVELSSMGQSIVGYAGLYRMAGERVIVRFIADNTWKIFAINYEQKVVDEFAWKRSAIASQKVMEFGFRRAGENTFRMESPRVKMLKSGVTTELRRPDCARLGADDPTVKAAASHARLAMRYVDRVRDSVPAGLDNAAVSLTDEIEAKKRKEMEWFERAPGLLKMMAADRLLEELRKADDAKCVLAKTAFEKQASAAMAAINNIGESELAKTDPRQAEALAGSQLTPPFAQFLEVAGQSECLMEEASAIGL